MSNDKYRPFLMDVYLVYTRLTRQILEKILISTKLLVPGGDGKF